MKNRFIIISLIICILAAVVLAADIAHIKRYTAPISTPAVNEAPETAAPTPGPTEIPPEKAIYLTFDDGPYKYTERLLDILDEYGVKATFFVTDQNPEYAWLIKKAYDSGHSVGVHTASHEYKYVYSGKDSFYDDFYKMQNIIKDHTGSYSMLYRFPGGSSNTISGDYSEGIVSLLAEDLEKKGYKYFDWNINSGDTEGLKKADDVFNNTVSLIKENEENNSVILMHDIFDWSVDAVPMIIEWGLENGYSFKALDEDSPAVHFEITN